MSLLTIDALDLTLGETPVLRGLSLSVEAGAFVSILGPSGSGKSSLFRVLTGDLSPSAGRIDLNGRPLAGRPGAFAYMPQRDALLPWRRIIDNLTLGLEVQGVSRRAARAQVQPLLAEFGLEGFEHAYPAELSGGMRQRAALLRTAVQNRPVQLLDEPFGALDALTRRGMQRWLEARWMNAGWTTVLVTHDVREAVALSDTVFVLSRRPATVIAAFSVDAPRPRLGRKPPAGLHALEDDILQTLLTQTGD